jgi:YbbR domain-containing protein
MKLKKPGKTTAFFICVLIAAFLWLVKALNTTYTYSIKVPVSFKNIPSNRKPVQNLPERLNVDIKASGLKLLFILSTRPFKTLSVDFSNLKSVNRQSSFVLSNSALNIKSSLGFEAHIVQVNPDTLYFVEKKGFQKNVPVKALINIKCAKGYSCRIEALSPTFINITGDSNKLRVIDTLYTSPITLQELSRSVVKQLDIVKPIGGVFLDNNRTEIKINVEQLKEYTIEVPLEAEQDPAVKGVHFYPGKVKIKYTGLSVDGDVSISMFRAVPDIKNAGLRSKAPVVLKTFPGDVNIISITPPEVEFLIIKK